MYKTYGFMCCQPFKNQNELLYSTIHFNFLPQILHSLHTYANAKKRDVLTKKGIQRNNKFH